MSAESPELQDKRAPGRPRSDQTQQAVLDAAVELLHVHCYSEISIERIAAHAKVGKQSIYRRWPSKADLVLEAYTQRAWRSLTPLLPSADAFMDLEDDLKRFYALMTNEVVAKGARSLIAEAQWDEEFRAKFYAQVMSIRCEAIRHIFQHGQRLGQFRTDLDEDALAHLIHGAFWYRFLSGTQMKLDAQYAANVVALLRPAMEVPRETRSAPVAG
jgi:AcrR family transcriptional regulator